jgi:hypothetical protein
MYRRLLVLASCLGLSCWAAAPVAARAAVPPIRLVERPPNPHGSPRPARDATNVPIGASLYFELEHSDKRKNAEEPRPDSVVVEFGPEGGPLSELLAAGQRFSAGSLGWMKPKSDLSGNRSLAIYIELARPLKPQTVHVVRVWANPNGPDGTRELAGNWRFTTVANPSVLPVQLPLDMRTAPIQWRGRFFSGLCNVVFCTEAANYGPTYDLMAQARKRHPRAWSYQRDFWTTGTEFRPPAFLLEGRPNIVRERETCRITAMETSRKAVLLRLESAFGQEQYGIPAGPLDVSSYRPGDEVLIADGLHDARTKVIAVDALARTVLTEPFANPPGGWKIAYEGPLPKAENPDAPGLFPPGGCYLRKFAPAGTPCYYWGRLDKQYDLIHRVYKRRIMVNFADAPGDLARDGRSWTTVKDEAQWHEVARVLTGHMIDRYGPAALEFTWSVFNEPDLGPIFWRASWDELQRFYDYTTDAILRAFEDRGYDANEVFIGGLELGGIFGIHLRLREFLAHCSPRAEAQGALPRNAAVADRRIDGKRSKRVEALCREHNGKGSPCDFISIHSYDRAEMMAAKLARAKEMALEIDSDYYDSLWVNSHESCPDWLPPPDEAATESYLGNGYFETWCADVVRRQLAKAAQDPRYAYGETMLTVWPPPTNLVGLNAITRVLRCDDNGDGRADRNLTIPMPVFHMLGMLSDQGDRYWVLPERVAAGAAVSGFASTAADGAVRVLLYAHQAQDTQSRSDAEFDVMLDLDGLVGNGPVRVDEYRFDKDHNSPFRLMRDTRQRGSRSGHPDGAATAYPTDLVEAIRKKSECEKTGASTASRTNGSHLRLSVRVGSNGCNFVVIKPQ